MPSCWRTRFSKVFIVAKLCAKVLTFVYLASDLTLLQVEELFCILDTNAYAILCPKSLETLLAVYVKAANINHECKPNTR